MRAARCEKQEAGAQVIELTPAEKLRWIRQLLRKLRKSAGRAVVFTSTKQAAVELHDQLKHSFQCTVLPECCNEQLLNKFAARQWLFAIAWAPNSTKLQPKHELEAVVHYDPPSVGELLQYPARERLTERAASYAITYHLVGVERPRKGEVVPLVVHDDVYASVLKEAQAQQVPWIHVCSVGSRILQQRAVCAAAATAC